jgi:succinate dehydrogenase, cytochrome b556 subunit
MSVVPAGTLYRGKVGMWSWFLHRISGVAIFFFLLVHILDTALVRVSPEAYNVVIESYKTPVIGLAELGLVGAILFHGLNGVRMYHPGRFLVKGHKVSKHHVLDCAGVGSWNNRLLHPWPPRASIGVLNVSANRNTKLPSQAASYQLGKIRLAVHAHQRPTADCAHFHPRFCKPLHR